MSYYYAIGPVPYSQDLDDPSVSLYIPPERTVGWIDTRPANPDLNSPAFFAFHEYPDHLKDTHAIIGDGNRLEEYFPSALERSAWETLYGVKANPSWTLLECLRQLFFVQADPEGLTLCKPGALTHNGYLELHLGGHSRILREKFTGKDHIAWPALQKLQQVEITRIAAEQTTQAEKIRKLKASDVLGKQISEQAKGRKDGATFSDIKEELAKSTEEVPGKILSDLCNLYKCDAKDLLPKGLDIKPIKPDTEFSDDFNRDNGDVGANWSVRSGAWSVASNRLSNNSGTDGTYVRIVAHATALSSGNHYSQITVIGSSNSSTTWPGCSIRNAASGEECIFCRISPTNTSSYKHAIYKLVGSTRTAIANSGDAGAYGNPIKLHGDGSTLTYYYNGGQVLQVTDSAHQLNVRVGACMHPSTGSATYDDFSAVDLLAPPPPPATNRIPAPLAIAMSVR